ncbi:MAG: 3'-5' exonuclease domain-containing protein 2 [Bacteroidaceae bacterium]|nr:3'-5' exonuclease domain-containing protein 2 [Bacteroidaceae bacterium]
MKILKNKLKKEEVSPMPQVLFPGRIITIYTEGEVQRAVDYLLDQPILGIDTETRPSFQKGKCYKVCLVQVSTHDTCFLFRLNFFGLPKALIRLLEDTSVPKVGLSLKDDFASLKKRANFNPGKYIELQEYVKSFGIQDMSLQKLYANVFGERISKAQRLSNWEANLLTDAQKRYAATDAWACIRLYEELEALKKSGEYKLEVVVDKHEENIPQEG